MPRSLPYDVLLRSHHYLERAREELTFAYNMYEQIDNRFCMDQIDEEQRELLPE
jgi:hypothetical protein